MHRALNLNLHLLCFLLMLTGAAQPSHLSAQTAAFHATTNWQLQPSLKYDALCLLNALSGDPYYLRYYQAEYDHFHPLFTPQEQAAFLQLKRVIKDDGRDIVSAKLTLYYSVVDDETLPEMIHTAQDSSAMKAAMQKTSYWDAESWQNYEAARPALDVALRALERVGFPAYWEANAKPRTEKRITELSPDVKKYNVIPVIESYLGFPLPSGTIKVYLLAYSEPHGIRITGLRFLTHFSYPFTIVLHNAIHESMHPPYPKDDVSVHKAIELLGRDPLVIDKVEHHDDSSGYNTTAAYIEEDSVEALEQIVSEKFGVGRPACQYWRTHDGGMHVLAGAMYAGYKQAVSESPQPYSQWFTRAVETGQLRGTNLKTTVESFFSVTACYRSWIAAGAGVLLVAVALILLRVRAVRGRPARMAVHSA